MKTFGNWPRQIWCLWSAELASLTVCVDTTWIVHDTRFTNSGNGQSCISLVFLFFPMIATNSGQLNSRKKQRNFPNLVSLQKTDTPTSFYVRTPALLLPLFSPCYLEAFEHMQIGTSQWHLRGAKGTVMSNMRYKWGKLDGKARNITRFPWFASSKMSCRQLRIGLD